MMVLKALMYGFLEDIKTGFKDRLIASQVTEL
jgi:hypothetical protein